MEVSSCLSESFIFSVVFSFFCCYFLGGGFIIRDGKASWCVCVCVCVCVCHRPIEVNYKDENV